MSPPLSLSISIQEEGKVFFPGETVMGAVEVNVLSETSVKSVKLKMKGYAEVKWEEYHHHGHHVDRERSAAHQGHQVHSPAAHHGHQVHGSATHNGQQVHRDFHTQIGTQVHVGHQPHHHRKHQQLISNSDCFYQKEKYYKINLTLYERESYPETLDLGVHKFNFSFELPVHIPCSFESKIGHVRHVCKVDVDVSGHLPNIKSYAMLSVGVITDLNMDPMAQKQIIENEAKKRIIFKRESPSLSLSLNIDHSGFVPGENLVVNAACSNRSNKATKTTKLKLFQTITYNTPNKTKVDKKLICSKVHGETEPGGSDVWSGEQLTIPPLPPSGLPGCSIIETAYHLKFTFTPHFPSRDLSVSVPILIGTIPLKEIFATFVPGYSETILDIPEYSETFLDHLQSLVPNFEDGCGIAAMSSDLVPDTWKNKQIKSGISVPWSDEYPGLPLPSYKSFNKEETEVLKTGNDETETSDLPQNQKPTKYFESKENLNFSPFYVYYIQEIQSSHQRTDEEIKKVSTKYEFNSARGKSGGRGFFRMKK